MSIDYKLANIFGTVYSQGNLEFTPDGTSVLSPVGNRVSCFDVKNNKSFTFAYEHRKNVARIAINKQATLLLSIDEDGRGILVNFRLRTVLHHINFKEKVGAVRFAPDGQHIAVATGRRVQMWRTPTDEDDRQFAPFVRHRVYTGHYNDVTALEWSADSRFLLTASKDMTARIFSLHTDDSDAAAALQGHRDGLVGAFFSADQETIYTVSRDGAQFQWEYSDEEDRWVITEKHYFNQKGGARVRCAAFHAPTKLLTVGFTTGVFGLYELPALTQLQTLSISQNEIDFVSVNSTGEWLLFGAAKLGQLLVWEWQSESYVLRQQSHFDALNAVAYSPDGSKVVTGADDGKIKVWDAASGFAIVTFEQHTAAVTALAFSRRGNVLFSASLDGSVRAWDLLRYRNFRTFTAPARQQFTALAVDPSGELVCAGSLNDFDIHVWNVQTSQLVDRLAGHEGPVSALDFSGDGATLVSASWDHSVRLWNFFGRSALSEPLMLQSEVLAVKFRPDGKQVAAAAMDGQIQVWDAKDARHVGTLDGRRDVAGGRHAGDRFAAANAARSRHFTTLNWSVDGRALLAGGHSRWVCLYDVANEVLLRKFEVSRNMAIDGTLDLLNSRNLTEAGARELLDTAGEASDLEDRIDHTLPGAARGDMAARRRPAIKVSAVNFSPTAASFSVASTEGLLIYAVDARVQFDPFELDMDVTVDAAITALAAGDYVAALALAFRLGEPRLVERVYLAVPFRDVGLVVRGIPEVYLPRLLRFIGEQGQESPHAEFNLLWLQAVLRFHGRYVAAHRQELSVPLRSAQRFVLGIKGIADVAMENVYRATTLDALAGTAEATEDAAADLDAEIEAGAVEA